MVNKYRCEVALPIGDKTYTLRFTTETLASIEGETGVPFEEYIAALGDSSKPKMAVVQKLLWHGLQEHHPELSEKDAGRLALPRVVLPYLIEAINGGDEGAKSDEARPTEQKPN